MRHSAKTKVLQRIAALERKVKSRQFIKNQFEPLLELDVWEKAAMPAQKELKRLVKL